MKSTPPIFNMGDFLKIKFSLHISILFSFRYVFVTYGPWSGDIKFSDSINRPRCILVIANKFSSPAERFFHLPLKDFFISRWKIAETGVKSGNASLLEKITDRQGKVKAKCGIAWMHNMQNVQCTDTGQLHWIICTLWQTKKYIFCRTAEMTPHSPKSTGYLVKIQF